MTRTQTLIATTVVAFVLPLGTAFAQVTNAPTAAPSRPAISQPTSPDNIRSPMQEQAMAPNMAPITTVCGPQNSVTMTDEYGRKYNCRGDRVR
jgi:hypothetical protein